jgi:hypothetical protein
MEVQSHAHGTFCFWELNTQDIVRDQRFYSELLGWSAFDVPSAGGGYSLMQLRGKDVAGLHLARNGPFGWLPYVSVGSADQAASLARKLGAAVVTDPFDVPGVGRMSMLQDPVGGRFALWQATGHSGAQLVDEPGAMYWNELFVNDVAAARTFYSNLFGWTTRETEVPSGPYTIFDAGEHSIAGMIQIQKEWGPVSPHWEVYFAVGDCDAAMKRAVGLGGAVLYGPLDVPGAGRLAGLQDPGRASFTVMQPAAAHEEA